MSKRTYHGAVSFRPAPFDVVEASRRVWQEQWDPGATSGMAVFTAILRSYQLLSHQVNDVMKLHGLTFARYEVLAWLAADPDAALTLGWISEVLRIPPATVTNLIDRLEADELVRRVPHPSDARTTLAEITPRGRRVATEATRDLNERVYQRIGLADDQRDQLVGLLALLRESGGEFDVERSDDLIDKLDSRRSRQTPRNGRTGNGRGVA